MTACITDITINITDVSPISPDSDWLVEHSKRSFDLKHFVVLKSTPGPYSITISQHLHDSDPSSIEIKPNEYSTLGFGFTATEKGLYSFQIIITYLCGRRSYELLVPPIEKLAFL
jgi:hypothetical protein